MSRVPTITKNKYLWLSFEHWHKDVKCDSSIECNEFVLFRACGEKKKSFLLRSVE